MLSPTTNLYNQNQGILYVMHCANRITKKKHEILKIKNGYVTFRNALNAKGYSKLTFKNFVSKFKIVKV